MTERKGQKVARYQAINRRKTEVRNEIKLDAQNPIPIELGVFSNYAANGSKYIPFLHPKDNFFNLLLELRLLSPTHNACVTTKTNYTIGEGLLIEGVGIHAKKEDVKDAELYEFLQYLQYVNNKKKNINSVLRKVVDGYLTFGNMPVEFVRLTVGDKKFLYAYPKNVLDCRLLWPDDKDEVTHVVISKSFRRDSNGSFMFDEKEVKKIPLYKPGSADDSKYWLKDGAVERTVLWLSNEYAGYDYYGMPSSVPGISHQKLEYEAVRYNLDTFDNNMTLGGEIFLTGSLSPAEANKIATSIIKRHTGKGKQGRIGVWSSESGLQDAKWIPHNTEKEGSYTDLDEKTMAKIILTNEWDAVLAGLQSADSLGKGAGYLEQIFEQKKETVIKPLQATILSEFIAVYFEIYDKWMGKRTSAYKVGISQTRVVNKNNNLIYTPQGLQAWLALVKSVADGYYPLDGAIQLAMARFGLTEDEAKKQLGNINVRSSKNKAEGTNIPK